MALLSYAGIAALAFATACYSPELSDCSVQCARDSDCAPDQVCGNAKLCAAPAMSNRCELATDAGVPMRDARPPDATPDAQLFELTVKADGPGIVELVGGGACRAADCRYRVPAGTYMLRAMPDANRRIEKWLDACEGSPAATCTVEVTKPLKAGAKFR